VTSETPISKLVRIEELDLRLIELLETDPRQPRTELASSLGISRPTVGAMLQRLINARVIRTVCLVDHIALGYENTVLFGINVTPGGLLEVAERLASLAPIHYVALCAGPFDIVSWGIFKGSDDLLDFLVEGLGKIPGLSRYETIMCHELRISPAFLAEGQGYRPRECQASLDQLDFGLIAALQRNSTESTASLAVKLGTSQPTVVRRMKRLLNEGVIRFVTMVSAAALGYNGNASIGIRVSPDRIKDVAEAVAGCRSVHSVSLCTGRYDVLAWVVFRERRDLMRILTEELGKIPGINAMEAVTNLKTIRSAYMSVDWQGELWTSLKRQSRRLRPQH
jgi:Lrp/AsnC family transcriptional regulator for asnA, asnC and gidA